MQQIWERTSSLLWSIISRPTVADLVDIVIVAVLFYQLLALTRDTRASQVLKGLLMLLAVYWISELLGLRALNEILKLVVTSGPVVVVVLFQSELRRALEQLGRASSTRLDRIRAGENQKAEKTVTDEIIAALVNLSRRRVGALVVIEQQTGLNDVIETGTHIDGEISAPLIENIFEPNTPLHDGAMIVRGTRIEAAACILTLSDNAGISRDLGTRHRAALGISEVTDSVTLIVSEETGIISMARSGRLTRHLDQKSLRQALEDIYGEDAGGSGLLGSLLAKRGQGRKTGGRRRRKKKPDEK